jgi:hypothetical protein
MGEADRFMFANAVGLKLRDAWSVGLRRGGRKRDRARSLFFILPSRIHRRKGEVKGVSAKVEVRGVEELDGTVVGKRRKSSFEQRRFPRAAHSCAKKRFGCGEYGARGSSRQGRLWKRSKHLSRDTLTKK